LKNSWINGKLQGNLISGKRYSGKRVFEEMCFRGNGPWGNEIRGIGPRGNDNTGKRTQSIFIYLYIDGDLYEGRKFVLPNFTRETYDVIYAKYIFSYNIVNIYQANRLNF
jgi:hypothetical protein